MKLFSVNPELLANERMGWHNGPSPLCRGASQGKSHKVQRYKKILSTPDYLQSLHQAEFP